MELTNFSFQHILLVPTDQRSDSKGRKIVYIRTRNIAKSHCKKCAYGELEDIRPS